MTTSMRTVGTAVTVCSGTEPGDELDLDGDADRPLGQANRCAGMAPGIAEDLDQQGRAQLPRTAGVWSKPGAAFTMPKTLMIRWIQVKIPSSA